MAKPTAVTEAGTAKVLLLADSTAGTPGANTPAAVTAGTSGEATYPVGWLGVATHRQGDGRGTPGGFVVGTPIVVAGGFDNSAGGVARGIRTDENGVLLMKQIGALDLPLSQGTVTRTVSAASETPFTVADPVRYQYLQRLHLICVGTVSGSAAAFGSFVLKNGSAGTVVDVIPWTLQPQLRDQIVVEYRTPKKTGGTGGSFTLTPSSTYLGTWAVLANGFLSAL